MFPPVLAPVSNFTPDGDSLRNYVVGVEYSPRSQDRLAGYHVSVHNIATGEIRTTQVCLSSEQAFEVATVIHDILYYAE